MFTAAQFFRNLPQQVEVDDPDQIDAVLQLELSGDGGGQWFIHIKDGTGTMTEGACDNPIATVRISAENYMNMVRGKLDSFVAYRQGLIEIDGDENMAMRIRALFGV